MFSYFEITRLRYVLSLVVTISIISPLFSQQAALGDFLWYDLNNDGIQDPGEPQLNGVIVEIYTELVPGTYTLVGQQTSTADGTYCFTEDNTTFIPGNTYYLTIPNPVLEPGTGNPTTVTLQDAGPPSFTQDLVDSDAFIAGFGPFIGQPTIEFVATAGFAEVKSLDFGFYTLCADLEIEIPPIFFACEGEQINVVADVTGATGNTQFDWSTGDVTTVNELTITASTSQVYSVTVTDDLGCSASAETYFEVERCPLDLSLTKTVDLMDVLLPGDIAEFTISVCNEGESVVDSIEVYDYLPNGYILTDPAWTIIAATATQVTANIELSISNGGLPPQGLEPGLCIDIPLLAEIDPCAGAGNTINTALINFASDLYGFQDDVDSSPGAAILDEDDTDAIAAPIFDLALRKVITSGPGPHCVGDVITFDIEVINQASAVASDITIIDYLPEGLTFNEADNGGWTYDPVGEIASFQIPGNLNAGESIFIPISLVVGCGTTIDAWTNIAEIYSAEDQFGQDMSFFDLDSQYDDIPDNDIGGTPLSMEDDHVDDNGADKDGNFITDEDDHDPALVPIFDLALKKEVATPGPYDYGQNVTFNITVCNQGNIVARDIDIVDYIPAGYTFHPTANSPMWSQMGMTASTMTIGQLPPEECTIVPLVLIVNQTNGGPKDWTNYAEITGAFDNLGMDMTNNDMDSTPGSNTADEQAVCLGDPDDDNLDGKGPKMGEDEDDHDPAGITIIDLALRKNLLTAGPYAYGDLLTYQIEVFNQGSDTVASVGIIDYFNEGLALTNTNFPMWENGINPNTATTKLKDLPPGESEIVTIEFVLSKSMDLTAWDNCAEVYYMEDSDWVDLLDEDSTPDDINGNDIGGNVNTPEDDEINDNGADLDGDGVTDEDDHDCDRITVYDLALTKTTTITGPFDYGQVIPFTITICNQGNGIVDQVNVQDYIPPGFAIVPDANWTAAGLHVTGQIIPGQCITVPLEMTLEQVECPEEISWYNYAEIISYVDEDGITRTSDLDSDHGSDTGYERSVLLGDDFDDDIDGCGAIENEDEDDHDVSGLDIYDLALRKTSNQVGPAKYGDVITFTIDVINQGSQPVRDVSVIDYFPDGFTFLPSNAGVWSSVSNSNIANATIDYIEPCETSSLTIQLMVSKSTALNDNWINYAEIQSFKDIDFVDVSNLDVDSTPDGSQSNDIGGTPDSPEDDHIADSGDDYDGDGITDEDDHDPERIAVYDVAMIKTLDTPAPYTYGQTLDFTVTICNQGNEDLDQVTIQDHIPAGLSLVADANWTAAGVHVSGIILPDECVDVPLQMIVNQLECSDQESWINYAEVMSYVDEDGVTQTMDADSMHGSDSEYENAVQPGDPFDDDLFGCGEGVSEDEDDHDVAGIEVFDLALRKTLTTAGPFKFGNTVTFQIEVFNQGSETVRNVEIVDYIPVGMSYLSSNVMPWTSVSNSNMASATIDQIEPCESAVLTLDLMLTKSVAAGDNWINEAEIKSFMDEDLNVVSDLDFDSTPDSTQGNDIGGNTETCEDNEIHDNGADLDGDGCTDEDDHDPERIPIYDVAMIKTLDTPPPHQYGQTLDFTITICNQGNEDLDQVTIQDHIPAGLTLIADANWTAAGVYISEIIAPDDCIDVPLQMTINQLVCSDQESWINYAEVVSYVDEDGVTQNMDADSMHDSDNDYENAVQPGDTFDDDLFGCGESEGEDEDDHDVAGIEIYDLALRKTNVTAAPYKYGDVVTFFIDVTNQGSETVRNVVVVDYIDDGMQFATSNTMPWSTISGSNMASATIDELTPCQTVTLPVQFVLLKNTTNGDNWINEAEIKSFMNTDLEDVSLLDFDSTPDAILGNDIGGTPETCEDGEINDSGTDLDGDGCTDEDDHDPERIPIYDVAMIKTLDTPAPHQYGQTLDFTITICNQGNEMLDQVTIQDHIPAGLSLVADANWTAGGQHVTGLIAPDECIDVPLQMTINQLVCSDQESWINYAEVVSYVDEDGVTQNMDADSMHDSNNAYENAVQPGDAFDDDLFGCGESEGEDEDDHDVAGIEIYDLALNKTTTSTGPYKYGDIVTFNIEVFNQGSETVKNILITDYIPDGMAFMASNAATWSSVSNSNLATATIEELEPCESEILTIDLRLTKSVLAGDNWINEAEITTYTDENWNPVADQDFDSTIDGIQGNDIGGTAETCEDDEIHDNGADLDGDGCTDEDDHDPERIPINDVALIKELLTPEPAGGFNYGDVLTFRITVCNQGNESLTDILVQDHLPPGLAFVPNNGWTAGATYTFDIITPDDCKTVNLDVTIVKTDGGEEDWINYAEIVSYVDEDGVTQNMDADSMHDSNNAYENAVQPGDPFDDDLFGCGESEGEDEDDHDVAGIEIVDLALRKTTTQTGPFKLGDVVCYDVEVFNQGSMKVTEARIADYIPNGLNYLSSNFPTWDTDPTGLLAIGKVKNLMPGDSEIIEICLEVDKYFVEGSGDTAWDNIAEIYYMEDDNWNNLTDIDSQHDVIPDNDCGDGVQTPDDNEIDECGCEADPDEDEDDHDPERIEIFDLALIKTIDTPEPYAYCQDITFTITVCNQGNEPATQIGITDHIPAGYDYDPAINGAWSGAFPTITTTVAGPLMPSECIDIPLILKVNNTSGGYTDWTNYAEITSAANRNGIDRTNWDLDSTPNSNAAHELAIQAGDPDDDNLDGCGPSRTEDEDDHDPAGIEVFDLALDKRILTPGPYDWGDTVCYKITVYNQGNLDARNIGLIDYHPVGLENVINNYPTWDYDGTDRESTHMIMGPLAPGDNVDVDICLEVQKLKNDEDAWDNRVEIYFAKDIDFITRDDIDSSPDFVVGNDIGGRPWTLEDNYIDDDGTDCDNTNIALCRFDEIGIVDEDDEDVARIEIPDLALRKRLLTPAPHQYGDLFEFDVCLFNQGNEDANNIEVTDYLPDGYVFDPLLNPGWSELANGDLQYTYAGPLAAVDSVCIPLFLEFVCTFGGEKDWINYAEITNFEGRECSFPDGGFPYENRNDWEMDSTPGSNSEWEQNVEIPLYNDPLELAFPWDDEICGCGPLYDQDEDDHDPAGIEVYDLAILKDEISTGPYIYGDIVQYDFIVYNQGSTDAFEVEVTDYIPCGLEFVQDDRNEDWIFSPFEDLAMTTVPDSILPGDSYIQPIFFRVVPCCDEPIAINWTNTGEVSDGETEYLYDAIDIDSTPDTINQETNVIDDALKDPTDEDDHDIEKAEVFDLALRKTTTYVDLELDDPNTFTITVFNQGNMVIQDVTVVDYPSSAYQFTTSINPGWTTGSTGYLYYTFEDIFLQPGDSIKVDINLTLDASLVTQLEDQYNCAEIVSFTDEFGNDQSANDADSVPDDNPSNDNVVIPGDQDDDEIKENGPKLNPFEDEDDKDVADVQVLGKIGDWVWIDCNGNGIQDIGEIGLEGVRVDLVDAWNIVIRSVYTDANGRYLFELVPPGDYFVRFTLPSGYEFTFPNVGTSEYHDSDVDNSNGPGTTAVENIAGRECDLESFDAGVYECIEIGQYVWYDSNENDIQEATENGINGVKVELYRLENGNFILWDYLFTGPEPGTASGDGYYKFCTAPGTYYLKYIVSGYGLVPVTPNNANDNEDSDVTGANGINTTNTVTVDCNGEYCNINAGFQAEAVLGNRVWQDDNGNGMQDAPEQGMQGVQVRLYDMNGSMVDQVNTDSDGYFQFDLLPAGDYYLQYNPTAGFVASPSNMGGDDTMDSDIDHSYGYNTTSMITLTPGDNEETFDAGFYQSTILSLSDVSLEGRHDNGVNLLAFQVNQNDLVKTLEIYRAVNNDDFKIIASLDATDNTSEGYNFVDDEVSANGTYYYRINANLENSDVEYSNVVAIDIMTDEQSNQGSFTISPNPSNGDVWIRGKNHMLDGQFEVIVVNANGQSIYNNLIQNASNEENYRLDLTHLPSGMYEVQISSQNGNGNYRILIMD